MWQSVLNSFEFTVRFYIADWSKILDKVYLHLISEAWLFQLWNVWFWKSCKIIRLKSKHMSQAGRYLSIAQYKWRFAEAKQLGHRVSVVKKNQCIIARLCFGNTKRLSNDKFKICKSYKKKFWKTNVCFQTFSFQITVQNQNPLLLAPYVYWIYDTFWRN